MPIDFNQRSTLSGVCAKCHGTTDMCVTLMPVTSVYVYALKLVCVCVCQCVLLCVHLLIKKVGVTDESERGCIPLGQGSLIEMHRSDCEETVCLLAHGDGQRLLANSSFSSAKIRSFPSLWSKQITMSGGTTTQIFHFSFFGNNIFEYATVKSRP